MKNLLMFIISGLLVTITAVAMIRGIVVGKFELLSIEQLKERGNVLQTKIAETNSLNNRKYKDSLTAMKTAQRKLKSAKEDYLDIASISSEEEIKEANQIQTYAMEYLWSRIGNHATEIGVNLKLDVVPTGISNKNTLEFTVKGSYIGIRDFIYSLENDTNLAFKIQSFKMFKEEKNKLSQAASALKNSSSANKDEEKSEDEETALVATFTVTDIGIKEEKLSDEALAAAVNETNTENNTTNSTNGQAVKNETADDNKNNNTQK